MRELFIVAARRAGWLAARWGTPFHENPLRSGSLSRFAQQWEQGWSEFAAGLCDAAKQ